MTSIDALDPATPVIIGVGQAVERIDDDGYVGRSPVALAALAAGAALDDTGTDIRRLTSFLDMIAATRQFENSSPGASAPLGRSTKFPLSVARRLGIKPRRAVLEVAGGQSPQHLVNEVARTILSGDSEAALLVGAEAISTIRHLAGSPHPPDFGEDPPDPQQAYEDRGFGLEGLISREQITHGLTGAPAQYALLENARRAAKGMTRTEYAESMGQLFAPFTEVAAKNPYSAVPQQLSPSELITITDRNRMIADPYPRFLVARDQVNQAAAVLMTSVGSARRLGIDPNRCVFLAGQADLRERNLFERQALGEAPSAVSAIRHALTVAGLGLDDVAYLDLYSCFPIAVSNIADAFGLSSNAERPLTLAGGLPFFGGAGNNYSMHAIAEAVDRVRSDAGSHALVSANGGVLSKTSVGIYTARPTEFRRDDNSSLQSDIDALTAPPHAARPEGWAAIETYTVIYGRDHLTAIVLGRLQDGGARFIAKVADGDEALLKLLQQDDQPIGEPVFVTSTPNGNRASITRS